MNSKLGTLNPSNAVAITPGAWDARAPRRALAERIGGLQSVLIRIMSRLDTLRRRGQTPEHLAPIVAAWAGPLQSRIVNLECRTAKVGKKQTLYIYVSHPGVAMELRGKLPALVSRLQATGIEEVRLR